MRPNGRDSFTIAIICALALEAEAVEAYFDDIYDRLGSYYGKSGGDRNSYLNGRIGKHEVVLCYMPGIGKGSAAMVASDLRFSYTNIKITLVVGMCGAVPSLPNGNGQPIYLGDVLIGDSVIVYDFGKQYPDTFRRKLDVKHMVATPSHELRTLLTGLSVDQARRKFQDQMAFHLQKVQQRNPKWNRPESDDCLFESSYPHKHHIKPYSFNCVCPPGDLSDQICEDAISKDCASVGCNEQRISRRRHLTEISNAAVHIGTLASADTVMKSGSHRDDLANAEGVIGFEMEGAGVWDNFPCIIIKGVADYADSHKDRKWQLYAAANGAAAAKTFIDYLSPIVMPERQQVHWMVPFKKNGKFVGRQNEIGQLKALISNPDGPRELAVSGLGGVGKTQVALELACQIRDEDPQRSIFWIPCTSQESVDQVYAEIARRLELPGEADAKKEVQTYLSQTTSMRWLVIFDNADNEDMWVKKNNALQAFVPENENGHTLFTSRNHRLAIELTDSNVIKIPEYDVDTGIQFLRMSLGQKDLLNDHGTAILLLEKLAFLPLAITQAVAYINRNQINLSTYVGLLEKQEQEIIEVLSEDFQDKWRYKDVQNPVATTWWISFQQVQQLNPLAAEYLAFMACINPRDIPQSILPRPTSENEQIKAIGLLKSYAFVSDSEPAEDKLLNLHRLVYIATRNWMRRKEMFHTQLLKALDQLALAFPIADTFRPVLQLNMSRKYIPHVLSILKEEYLQRKQIKHTMLIGTISEYLIEIWRLEEAEELCTHMLRNMEALECDDQGIWRTVYVLTSIYRIRGLSQVGRELVGEFLDRERTRILHNVVSMQYQALSYLNFERNEEAKRLISAVVHSLAPRHLPVQFQIEVARIYSELKRYKESEDFYLEAIKNAKDIRGPNHPTILSYQASLAMMYSDSGQYTDAERLYLDVVGKSEAIHGPSSYDMLDHLFDLALTQCRQKKYTKAEENMIRVIEIKKRMGATKGVHIISYLVPMVELYLEWGKFKQAKKALMQLDEYHQGLPVSTPAAVHIGNMITNYREMMKNTEKMMKNTEKMMKNTEEMMKNTEKMMKNTEEMMKNTEEMKKNTEKMMKNIEEMMKNTEKMMKNIEEMMKNTEMMMKNIEEMMKNTEEMKKSTEKVLEIKARLKELLEARLDGRARKRRRISTETWMDIW